MGTTGSNDFPTTSNAFQTNFNGGQTFPSGLGVSFPDGSDMFISRLNIDGGAYFHHHFYSDNDGLKLSKKNQLC